MQWRQRAALAGLGDTHIAQRCDVATEPCWLTHGPGSKPRDQLIQKAPCNCASAQRLPDSGALISRSDVMWPQNSLIITPVRD